MGTISLDNSDRLFWLGRYTERVFTTLKALEALYDKSIEKGNRLYKDYLECFDLDDRYRDTEDFMSSFLFDDDNSGSVTFSLERAYDNGIVLRERISTEALSYLQLAKDTLAKAGNSQKGYLYELLPLEDLLFGFATAFQECRKIRPIDTIPHSFPYWWKRWEQRRTVLPVPMILFRRWQSFLKQSQPDRLFYADKINPLFFRKGT